jgi:diguanylate cyclase (GGDEF)-like protein
MPVDDGLPDTIATLIGDGSAVLGSLVVAERVGDVRTFTHDDLQLLQSVGTQVAAAVRNAQLIDRLRHDAGHDGLTGLSNRVAWESAAGGRLTPAAWELGKVDAVILVDLDGFKDVNDTLGHHRGDQLLVQVAHRLSAAVGERGLVARFGGDEFAVFVPGTTPDGAVGVAEAITAGMHDPVASGDVQIEVAA